jgi:hypothetical protein
VELAIALYAATVATAGAVWQVYQWRHGRRGHLDVRIRNATWWPDQERLSVAVFNSNSYPVRIESVWVELATSTGEPVVLAIDSPAALRLPELVPPHDSIAWEWNRDDIRLLRTVGELSSATMPPEGEAIVSVRTGLGARFEGRARITHRDNPAPDWVRTRRGSQNTDSSAGESGP